MGESTLEHLGGASMRNIPPTSATGKPEPQAQANGLWFRISIEVYRDYWHLLTEAEKDVYTALCSFADFETGIAYPSEPKLAERGHRSERSVQRAQRFDCGRWI